MMKRLLRTFYFMLMLFILMVCTLSFLVSTTPGLYTSIKLSSLFLPGSLKVHQLKGQLQDDFSIGELIYQHENNTIKIHNLYIAWHLSDLLHHQIALKKLSADSVTFTKDNSSKVITNISFSGLLNKQDGVIQEALFTFLDQKVSMNFKVMSQRPNTLSGTIKLVPKVSAINKLHGTINFGGSLDHIDWSGDLFGSAKISITGSLKQRNELTQIIKWTDLKWNIDKNQTIISPQGKISLSGSLPALNMEFTSKISAASKNYWQMHAKINGTLPWQWNIDANLIPPQSKDSLLGGLHTSLSVQGSIKDINHANFRLTVNPGHYQAAADSMMPSIPFKGGSIDAVLSPQTLQGKGLIAIDDNKELNVIFKLPEFDLSKGFVSTQALSGEVSVVLNSLNFLNEVTPDVNKINGSLIASLKIAGTLGHSLIQSKLNLNKASAAIPSLGLDLEAIDCTVVSKTKHWEATGSIVSAGKKLVLKGKGPLSSKFLGEIRLQGSDFPIAKTQEYQINISPQLILNLTPSNVHISGTILVPYAQIKPQSFSNSLTLPDDVVYTTNEESSATVLNTSLNTSMDVAIEMGNQVELNVKGLHATLAGIVKVKQLPQGPVNANGELTVKKGEYKAYGQDLDIEQGQLLFTGGSLDNPGINLKASKIIGNNTSVFSGSDQSFDFNNQNIILGNNIKVGVEVTGRLTAPKIILFSNPSTLSQADILSMLVLGRPASQANKAGGQLLLAAISSMNLGTGANGTQLLQQLKQTIGLDFNVQTNTNYNQLTNQVTDRTSLVVGRTLSKRLYLSYNVGLSQADPNVLTLKYLINKMFSVQITNSLKGSGIDLLYSHSKDKINE